MVKTDKRRKAPRLPSQIDRAIAAAEDKKAVDLVVLDLRKAAGFTDFFLIASGTNTRRPSMSATPSPSCVKSTMVAVTVLASPRTRLSPRLEVEP